jgi:lipid-A-disaccharide synthase
MKKIFISTGELSGDKLGAWFVKRQKQKGQDIDVHAVGGSYLESCGVKIYERIENLGFVGIVEILKHLSFIFKFLKKLSDYILENNFDEVVLVDFPGFNLLLAKRLKKQNPNLKITYLSPPQLWVWGAWRVKKLRKSCDEVIVLYPFEVEWYKKRGVHSQWLGYPFYDEYVSSFTISKNKQKQIAILPGSRSVEIKNLLPIFIDVIKEFQKKHSDVKWVLPLAESISLDLLNETFSKFGMPDWKNIITLVYDEEEKKKILSECVLAIAKPGTATLQLALLGVPTIIIYKSSFINYLIARPLIRVKYMGLPNLLLEKAVFPELLQGDCTTKKITNKSFEIYENFISGDNEYQNTLNQLQQIHELLKF